MMNIQIALISLISLTAISARSLGGYMCRDYPITTGNAYEPMRTVRVCGIPTYENEPNYLRTTAEYKARYSMPFSWPSQMLEQSRPTYNERNQFLPSLYSSINSNELSNRNLMKANHMLQKKYNLRVNDVSEVKNAVQNIEAYIQNTLSKVLSQNTNEQTAESVNVNLNLDPSLGDLLKQFIQLTQEKIQTSAKKIDEETTTANIEEIATEDNSTAEQDTTEESSTERDTREEDRTFEDLNEWIRRKFGPSVRATSSDEASDDTFNQTNEEDDDLSLESWFNSFYRLNPTTTTSDYNNLKESSENIEKDSDENSKENVYGKSSEESTENSINVDYSDENYETFFMPTTMKAIHEDTTVEQLEIGDRYDYRTPMSFEECVNQGLGLVHCVREERLKKLAALNVVGNSIESGEQKTEISFDSNESKESEEAEAFPIDVNGSQESAESTTAVLDSNESQDSADTEPTTYYSQDYSDYGNQD